MTRTPILLSALFALHGCGQAGAGNGPAAATAIAGGPDLTRQAPLYVLQRGGLDLDDDYGQPLAYDDPVAAGVALARAASADPEGSFSVRQQPGHWTLAGAGPELTAAAVSAVQGGTSQPADGAALEAGPVTLSLTPPPGTAAIHWALDGEPAGEGGQATLDLAVGDHVVTVTTTDTRGGQQSVDLWLSAGPAQVAVTLQWRIPTARENGEPLPVAELCCYQVQIASGANLILVDVSGGATDTVALELPPARYAFSVLAIDSGGLRSAWSDPVEADLI